MRTKKTPFNKRKIEKLVRELIVQLGENPDREGLIGTPQRMANMFEEIFAGYCMNSELEISFSEESDSIIAKDIQFYSMCEHHMLPFFGRAHVAYIPNGWITGLSKIARVVDVFSKRLQVQERLTTQILQAIQDALNPLGVAVVIEATHLCMMMRGVQKQSSVTTTSAFSGEFEKQPTRNEFINLIDADLINRR